MLTRRLGFLAALMVVAGAAPLAAQGPRGGMGRLAAPSLEELTTALKLTGDQQEKVGKLLAKWDGDTKGARETLTRNMQAMQQGGDVEALRSESMMAMQHVREQSEEMNKSIRGVLTPDQVKAFDEWLAQRMQQMRGGRPGGPPPALR